MKKNNKKEASKEQVKPVILFSFDGTIMDTEPAIIATYRELFDRHNKNDMFTKEIELAALDDSVSSVMQYCFPEEDTKKMVAEYNSWQRNHLIDLIQPMKGVKDLLIWLKKHEYKIATVSTRERSSVIELLEHAHMLEFFDVIIGGKKSRKGEVETDSLFTALKLLDAKYCVYIGDSAADIMTGRDAGVFTVGYVSNPDKAKSIVEERPDFATADILQLKKLLKGEALWLAYEIQYPDAEEMAKRAAKKKAKEEEKAKAKAAKKDTAEKKPAEKKPAAKKTAKKASEPKKK